MPPKRKSTKKPLKKKPYKRINKSVAGEKLTSNYPIATNQRVTLRYNDYNKLTSTTGSSVSQQFRMNSCFDPDYTYLGHQPYGWDQISVLYNYYCVVKFTIVLRYTALNNPMRVVIEPRFNNSSVTADLQAVMERNRSLNFIAVPNETGYKKYTCYMPNLAGYPSMDIYKQNCGAVPSSNPVVLCWLTLHTQSMDVSTTGSLLFDYELHFDTTFEQPLQLAQS